MSYILLRDNPRRFGGADSGTVDFMNYFLQQFVDQTSSPSTWQFSTMDGQVHTLMSMVQSAQGKKEVYSWKNGSLGNAIRFYHGPRRLEVLHFLLSHGGYISWHDSLPIMELLIEAPVEQRTELLAVLRPYWGHLLKHGFDLNGNMFGGTENIFSTYMLQPDKIRLALWLGADPLRRYPQQDLTPLALLQKYLRENRLDPDCRDKLEQTLEILAHGHGAS